MIIKIKKYVAEVSVFVEHEDGTITKENREIVLHGRRFSTASVKKAIPEEARLIQSGWRVEAYEVDDMTLEAFLEENGKVV